MRVVMMIEMSMSHALCLFLSMFVTTSFCTSVSVFVECVCLQDRAVQTELDCSTLPAQYDCCHSNHATCIIISDTDCSLFYVSLLSLSTCKH